MNQAQDSLEVMYINEYLRSKGYSLVTVHELPAEELKKIMTEASTYASTKLAEIESRAQFRKEIRST